MSPSATRGSVNVPRGFGRVNMITCEEPDASKNTMASMVLLNGGDDYTLFDTGATHSFNSGSFVEENRLKGLRCSEPFGVWMLNGENGLYM